MDKEQPEQSTPAEAVLDELRADAEMLKVHGDAIAKTFNAINITAEYGDKGRWEVHVNAKDFEKVFGGQATLISERDSTMYPYERSILIEGVKFYYIMEGKELTKKEHIEQVHSQMERLCKLEKELEKDVSEEEQKREER